MLFLVTGLILAVTGCTGHASSQEPDESPAQKYTADEKSLAKHYNAPDWFRDAKLGIYFTWGPYTVAAHQNEWYPRWMHFDVAENEWEGKSPGYHHDLLQWHTEKFGHPSVYGYHDMIEDFTAETFDAEEWADLFLETGASTGRGPGKNFEETPRSLAPCAYSRGRSSGFRLRSTIEDRLTRRRTRTGRNR